MELQHCVKRNLIDPSSGELSINISCTAVPLEDCDVSKHIHIDSVKGYFNGLDLKNWYCIAESYWRGNSLEIAGTFDAGIFQWLKYSFYQCSNITGVYEQ